ncbi:DUF7706 family protein [Photorhabdus kleinii]
MGSGSLKNIPLLASSEEAYQIKDAIAKLQSALAYCGYSPR